MAKVSFRRMSLFGTQSFKVLEATATVLGKWQQEKGMTLRQYLMSSDIDIRQGKLARNGMGF